MSWSGCLGTDFRDELLDCFHFNYWELFGGKVFTSRKQVRYKKRALLLLEALEPGNTNQECGLGESPTLGSAYDFF